MPVRAVIFDRDGVLTYFNLARAAEQLAPLLPISLDALGRRWFDWGQAVGFPTDLTSENAFWAGFWDQLGDNLSLPAPVQSRLRAFDYTTLVTPFADARPALAAAQARGLCVGVLSNFSLASLDSSLAAAGLADLIDVAHAAPVIGVAKPAPAAYLSLMEPLGVQPEECLFFDDEAPCVAGARRVGMHAYRVDRRRESHAVAEGVVADLSAVPDIIAGLL